MKYPQNLYNKILNAVNLMDKRISIEHRNAVTCAVEHLQASGVISIPTDTVYGLACNALNQKAIHKLYDIKGRSEHKPLAICLGRVSDLNRWAKINHLPTNLLNSLLPGPVTLVLECTSVLDKSLKPDSGKVGIRIPDNQFVQNVLSLVNYPLALTSANASGEPSSLNVEEFESLWPYLNGIFDAGPLGFDDSQRAASTVIDLASMGSFKILRHGISSHKIIQILNAHGLHEAINSCEISKSV
ncbi:yrdC domain-containing protein, mitochondrial [Chrysoperla carnea]|uniref:yrdC domain-containing protein, mitochondrial n=1 Tax=Chrysoperla carnea TaxID=189513 RepID=UPI001D088E0F|nr:yrdC domain-containing protein, mitochondrial [Chrysoperla carnea]